jgi:hypothetical protein
MLAPDRFDPTAHMADAAPAMELVLDAGRQAEVAGVFALVVHIAALVLLGPLPESVEPAPVSRP